MAKVNPFKLPVPPALSEAREFTDPLVPGETISLAFMSEPDYGEILTIRALAESYWEIYREPTAPPVHVGKREVKISQQLCMMIAILQTLQRGEREDRYGFEEWAAMSVVMPNAVAEIVRWAESLMSRASSVRTGENAKVPNVSAATTD